MVDVHFTLRGQMGGKRAEVRVELGQLRVQGLTVVTRQPALDLTFAFRDLTDLRVVRRVQWTYVALPLLFGVLIAAQRSESTRSSAGAVTVVFVVSLVLAFGLVAWLLPRNILRIATQDSSVELDISTFSRKRAQQLVDTVLQERPDLRGSESGPTRGST